MTSYQLILQIDELLSVVGKATALEKALAMLFEASKEMNPAINKSFSIGDGNNLWAHQQALRRTLDTFKTEFKAAVQIRQTISDIERFSEAFQRVLQFFPGADKEPLKNIETLIHEFARDYEAFLNTYSHQEEIQMLASGATLYSSMKAVINMLTIVKDSLQEKPHEVPQGEVELSLVFNSEIDLQIAAAKLSALHDLYQEVCELFHISTAQHPIRIVKIETGSLFVKILGSATALAIIKSWLEASVKWIYRTFTTEGKKTAIPIDIETINVVLGLRNSMRANGVSTDGMDENIQKAGIKVAQKVNILLGDCSGITIDDAPITLATTEEQKLLAASRTRLIGEGTQQQKPEK